MRGKIQLGTSFWLGITLLTLGILVLVFLFYQKPEKTEAATKTWVQEDWSGGEGQLVLKTANKYWSKTENVLDREGIRLKVASRGSIPVPKKESGSESSAEGGKLISEGANGKTERGESGDFINGSLISSILDVKETASFSGGKLDVNLSDKSSAKLYLQVGTLKGSAGSDEKLNYNNDIEWGEWREVTSERMSSPELLGHFVRYKVTLKMPDSSINSPHVTRVSIGYQVSSLKDIDPDKSWVQAESPVVVGGSSTIKIQLVNKSGNVVVLPEKSLSIRVSGLDSCKVSNPKLESEVGNINKSVYTAQAVSSKKGTAKIKVAVDTSTGEGRSAEGQKETPLNEGGGDGNIANPSEIILTDQPEIVFVGLEEAGRTYVSEGWLKSSIFDAKSRVSWSKITYQTQIPSGTEVEFAFRAGNNLESLGDFGVVSSGTDLGKEGRYFQYRVGLRTDNVRVTPALGGLKIEYSDLRGEEKVIATDDFGNIDYQKSSATATTPHRAGTGRSQILIWLRDSDGGPVAGFPATRVALKTDPLLGTIFYQKMKETNTEGLIEYQCASTIVSRKYLRVIIKDGNGNELFELEDRPVIDFVSADDKNVYLKSGELNSSVFDAKHVVNFGKISWVADAPEDTNLRVMIIAGNDLKSLVRSLPDVRFWREVRNGEDLKFKARYFKYKILFNNNDPHLTPTLKKIRVEYHSPDL